MNQEKQARLIRNREDLRDAVKQSRGTCALMMTKGNIHEGHLSLVEEARRRCDSVVASVFVNPLQLGEGVESSVYADSLERDYELLSEAGVDIVFAPSVDAMYPNGLPEISVEPGRFATIYEGSKKPGYYGGLCLLGARMFNLVEPDVVVVGQNDPQRVAVVRQLVRDLDYDIDVVAVPVQRDGAGIPVSADNALMDDDERRKAALVSAAVRQGVQEAAATGDSAKVLDAVNDLMAGISGIATDYVALVDPMTFRDIEQGHPQTASLIVAADTKAFRGRPSRRLTDNALVVLGR